MTRTLTTRRTVIAALAAGISWVAVGFESIVRPDPQDYRTVLWLVPWLCTTAAIRGLHRLHVLDGVRNRVEHAGYLVTIATAPFVAVGDLLLLRDDMDGIAGVAALVWTVGLVVYGIGALRARRFPWFVGAGIIASEPLTILAAAALSPLVPLQDKGSYSGAVMHGLVWLVVAAAVRRDALPAALPVDRRAATAA